MNLHPFAVSAATLCGVLLATPAELVAQRRGNREAAPPKLENLTYTERTFESPALGGRAASYGVFLPKDYDTEENAKTRYPLVIWLHGMFEDHNRFFQRGGAAVLDQLVGAGTIPPLVLVCADGDRSSFWTNAVRENSNYEDLVTKDLLDHIEATYRVRQDRDGRAITGVSMGGYGALKIAFKDPSRFGVVAAHSAAVLPADPDLLLKQFPWLKDRGAGLIASVFGEPLDVDRYRAENVMVLAEQLDREKLDGLKIYFDAGDEDRYGFHLTNQALHELLEKHEIPHVWRLVEGGGHSWGAGFTQEALTHSLTFVAQQFAARAATKGLSGLLGGEPTEDAGKTGGDGKK